MKILTILTILATAIALSVATTSCVPGAAFPFPGSAGPPPEMPDPDNPPVFVRGYAPAGAPGYAAPRVADMSNSLPAIFRDQPPLTAGEVDQFVNYLASGRRGSLPGSTKHRQQFISIKISNALWMLGDSSMTADKMERQYGTPGPVPTPSELSLVRKRYDDLINASTGARRR